MSFPSPGDLPDPGTEPRSPTLRADALPSEPPGKPKKQKGDKKASAPRSPMGPCSASQKCFLCFCESFRSPWESRTFVQCTSAVTQVSHHSPQPYADRKLLLTQALCQPRGKSRAAQALSMRRRSVPPGPQAPPPRLWTTGKIGRAHV